MTETSALDEVEAWVHWEIDKLSKRTMVGDRAIGVGDAEQIAVVAAHRAMEVVQGAIGERKAAEEETRTRKRLACHVVGHVAAAMLQRGRSIDVVEESAPVIALNLVGRVFEDDDI